MYVRLMVTIAALAVLAFAHADRIQYSAMHVSSTRYRGVQKTVRELVNSTSRSIRYYYSLDKESCFSWNVGLTVLKRYSLSQTTHACESAGSYTSSGTLSPHYTLRILAQPWREYDTYRMEKRRVYDDASYDVLEASYATRKETYEHYWTSTFPH